MYFEEDMALAPRSDQFERPVVIWTAFGVPAAVSSAMDAYVFLTDWPPSDRDEAHTLALKQCLAAVRGEVEAEMARGIFASWAERQDILAPDTAAFVRSGHGSSHGAP